MLAFYLSMLETEEDKLTFAEIYKQFKLPCLHVALKITKNNAMAEDAVHNAFLTVIEHKDEVFKLPCGKRKSRIVIITKNKAIDLMRSENRKAAVSVEETENYELADDFDISKSVENQETLEHLLNCISRLPELYKTAFEFKYVHEMSNPEIGELLDATPKTISMRIGRAKAMLKEMLNEEGYQHGR